MGAKPAWYESSSYPWCLLLRLAQDVSLRRSGVWPLRRRSTARGVDSLKRDDEIEREIGRHVVVRLVAAGSANGLGRRGRPASARRGVHLLAAGVACLGPGVSARAWLIAAAGVDLRGVGVARHLGLGQRHGLLAAGL